jgi:FkbM family methyltransferase
MRGRGWIKYHLYGHLGVFSYFGARIHFPRKSHAWRRVCEERIFEEDNVKFLLRLSRPATTVFDVGSNLGFMAAPILSGVLNSTVISFEPSPNTLPWLKKTIAEYPQNGRWQLVSKAVGSKPGVTSFSISTPEDAVFDGLRNTGRSKELSQIEVEVTTLDIEWQRLGCPVVSMIKIDVEGAELDVLRGAERCLHAARPFVLLEWTAQNLHAYGVSNGDLFDAVSSYRYRLYSLPDALPITCASELDLQSLRTEDFLMVPG